MFSNSNLFAVIGFVLIYGGGLYALIGFVLTFREIARNRKKEKEILERYDRIEHLYLHFGIDPKVVIEFDDENNPKNIKLEV